jgi:hypothetical protein
MKPPNYQMERSWPLLRSKLVSTLTGTRLRVTKYQHHTIGHAAHLECLCGRGRIDASE